MKFPKISPSVLPFVNKPYILFFAITERCNLRCEYCFGKYYSETGELSFKQIKKIFTEFYGLGVRRIAISGGEPLLHKDIDRVIKMAVELGFEVGINSNGILVPFHIKALRLVSNLSISLDGASEKIHDKYRGKGAFKKVLVGIEAAHKAGIPLHFCCTLTDSNLKEWPNILKLAKKYNALVLISPLYPRIRGEGGLMVAKAWENKMKKTLKDISKAKEKGANIFYSKETYELMADWPDYTNDISVSKIPGHAKCFAGKKYISMDSKGEILPCLRLDGTFKGASCVKLGVKDALKNMPSPPCKSCRWACFIEYNLLFNFRAQSVLNFLSNRIKDGKA